MRTEHIALVSIAMLVAACTSQDNSRSAQLDGEPVSPKEQPNCGQGRLIRSASVDDALDFRLAEGDFKVDSGCYRLAYWQLEDPADLVEKGVFGFPPAPLAYTHSVDPERGILVESKNGQFRPFVIPAGGHLSLSASGKANIASYGECFSDDTQHIVIEYVDTMQIFVFENAKWIQIQCGD